MGFKFNPFTGNLDISDTTTRTSISGFTDGYIPFGAADGSLDESANLIYDKDTDTFYVKVNFANYDPDGLDMGYSNIHDNRGYNDGYMTDISISNCKILDSKVEEEGSVRSVDGVFSIYLDGTWQDIVTNFRFREDETQGYELEHKPVGFNEWYEVMSGNSNTLGLNGLPLVQQYEVSMGAYPVPIQLDGGTF